MSVEIVPAHINHHRTLAALRRRREQSLATLARTEEEIREAAIAAASAGISLTTIANLAGCARSTLYQWLAEKGRPRG